MKGRKGRPENVTPLRPENDDRTLEERALDAAERMKPPGLSESEDWLWGEIAPELFKLGRLKAHFVHAVHEYVAVLSRLRNLREFLNSEGLSYEPGTGRAGKLKKAYPEVAQYNESWRQWRALANDLGLNPQAERGLGGAIRDLFDDPADEFL